MPPHKSGSTHVEAARPARKHADGEGAKHHGVTESKAVHVKHGKAAGGRERHDERKHSSGKRASSHTHTHEDTHKPTKALWDDEEEETEPKAGSTKGAAAPGATSSSDGRLKVNREYADRYEQRKRKQELARAEELGLLGGAAGAQPESEEEESEDEGEQLTADVEKKILQTLEAIRKKDRAIYEPARAFFQEPAEGSDEEGSIASKELKQKKKKVTAKDVLRKQLAEAAEKGATDAFAEEDDLAGAHGRRTQDDGDRNPRVYDAEQAALRKAFLASARADSSESESESDDLLAVRQKPAGQDAEHDDDDDDVLSVDKDELRQYLRSKSADGIAEHAADIADPEAFLNAFMRSRAWKEEEAEDTGAVPHYEDIVANDDEDEEELEKADEFEAAYNFRFEEPGGTTIVTHARNIDGSLRRKDDKRKQERERRKETKEKARAEAEAETRRLMNLKRQEIRDRMSRIQDVAGNGLDLDALAAALGDELDKDFDPASYDAKMAAIFGDGYYAEPEMEAPELPARSKDGSASEDSDEDDEDANAPGWVFGDGPRPAWAGPSAEELAQGVDGFDGDATAGTERGALAEEEDEEELDPAVAGLGRSRKHRRKQKASKTRSDVVRALALVEEEERAARERNADPDEVLRLGFEDVIAGGIKTRFKYVPVESQDFGLSAEEILMLDDHELNSYVGLKRLAPYREQEWQVPKSKRKHELRKLRAKAREEAAKILGTTTTKKEAGASAPTATAAGEKEEADAGADGTGAPVDTTASEPAAEQKKSRRRRHKKRAEAGPEDVANGEEAGAEGPAGHASESDSAAASAKPGKRQRDAEAPAAAASETSKDKSRRRRRKSSTKPADPDAVTALPSGVTMKKSRLASYNL